MRQPPVSLPRLLVLAVLLVPTLASAGKVTHTSYIETFENTSFRDDLATDAYWDTTQGRLRLPDFRLRIVASVNAGRIFGLAIDGNVLYVANSNSSTGGIQAYTVYDPTNPVVLSSVVSAVSARDIAIDGDRAYVAFGPGAGGVRVFDVSNPSLPSQIENFGGFVTPGAVELDGDYLLVGSSNTLDVIDITDPTSLTTIKADFVTPGSVWDIDLQGDYAYVANDAAGLTIVDVASLTTPFVAGSINTGGTAMGVRVDGNVAYVADGADGLVLIDVSDPSLPAMLGSVDTPGLARAVAVDGNRAFIADDTEGIHAIDVSNSLVPVIEHSIDTPGRAFYLEKNGEHVYVADFDSGFHVIDVSDYRTSPSLKASLPAAGVKWNIAVDGKVAYLALGASGVQAIDISAPESPAVLGQLPMEAYGVSVSGDIGVAASGFAIVTFDVSDPTSMDSLGFAYCTPSAVAYDVEIRGNNVYAVGEYGWLGVFDISDPTAPVQTGFKETHGDILRTVDIHGNYAYCAASGDGLYIFDISNPAAPGPFYNAPVANPGEIAYDVAVDGDSAYVAESSNLRVLDISDPTNPVYVNFRSYETFATGVAISGDMLFVCDYGYSVRTYFLAGGCPDCLIGQDLAVDRGFRAAVSGDYLFVITDDGLAVEQIALREFDLDGRRSYTIPLTPSGANVLKYRATATGDPGAGAGGSIRWTTDAWATSSALFTTTNWYSISPGDEMAMSRVLGRITTGYSSPYVDFFRMDWLFESANISSIEDIPGDQGGYVRLHIRRSALDFDGESPQVTMYDIYRRIDDPLMASAVTAAPLAEDTKSGPPVSELAGRKYVSAAAAGGVFPPGIWEHLSSLGSLQQDDYIAYVPTLADSSASFQHTSYVVVTHTTSPTDWYVGFPDSGYSIDNIVPPVPEAFAVGYNLPGGNALSWNAPDAPDVVKYRVYRSPDAGFVLSAGTLVQETAETSWQDPAGAPSHHYKVTAVDDGDNESDPASPQITTEATPTATFAFALQPNVPNPFNPTTTIRYTVAAGGGPVSLVVFDALGRRVRTLVDSVQEEGAHAVPWNGLDDGGRGVASGIYFYRLTAQGFSQTRKMVLLK